MHCRNNIYTPAKPRILEFMYCHVSEYMYYHINIYTNRKSTIYAFDIVSCIVKDQLQLPPILVSRHLEAFSTHKEYKLDTKLQEAVVKENSFASEDKARSVTE